jgi:hypothetical protein
MHARGWWWWWQSVGRVLDLAIARKPLADLYETWTLEIRSGRRGEELLCGLGQQRREAREAAGVKAHPMQRRG